MVQCTHAVCSDWSAQSSSLLVSHSLYAENRKPSALSSSSLSLTLVLLLSRVCSCLFSISLPDWLKFLSWPLAPRPLSGTFCVAWHTFHVCLLATTISDHSEWHRLFLCSLPIHSDTREKAVLSTLLPVSHILMCLILSHVKCFKNLAVVATSSQILSFVPACLVIIHPICRCL